MVPYTNTSIVYGVPSTEVEHKVGCGFATLTPMGISQ